MDTLFLERLKKIFGDKYESVVASFGVERKPVVRINTLAVSEDEGVARLVSAGVELERVGARNAYVVKNKTRRELTDLAEYPLGVFYIQSLSSMVPVWCIEQDIRYQISDEGKKIASHARNDNLLVLDMCAAPGSKTTQMAAVMGNRGQIYAHDVSRQRAYQLKANLGQFGVSNTLVSLGNSTDIWKKYGPIFDVVLLDAPCSSEGRFKSDTRDGEMNVDVGDWSMKKVERMAELQRRLIFSAVMCLKSGGVLVYSTCTFAPEENEAIVDFALKKFEGAVEVEDIGSQLLDISLDRGLVAWGGEQYDARLNQAVRIVPDALLEGFFVCKIRRN